MNLEQINESLNKNIPVYWTNESYQVKKPNGSSICDAYIEYLPTNLIWGLTNKKTENLIDKEEEFYTN
jgi:hypothetical protein